MKRQENQAARPTSGCLSVPLFNQKKRNRVPLTALPSENEFFSHSEYTPNTSSAISHNPTEAVVCCDSLPMRIDLLFRCLWVLPGLRFPFWCPSKPTVEQTKQLTSANAPEPQKNAWKFTNSFEPLRSPFEVKTSSNPQNTLRPTPTQVEIYTKKNDMFMTGSHKFQLMFNALLLNHATFVCVEQAAFPVKPATEHSLRILTAVIDGMRHWSQFKDKVPYLFEIFATLDSAVTVGRYGAKNFLLRDGKEVVQCVFYENEQVLPRLIRGQVHRCVGNYDRSKDVLMCVSVRPALPSELRNAQEAVKTCDAEMRALVKSLSEV
uniref:Spermatogenesis associated 22 n=1 Tax=Pundamilia nyererei TaxID=303518 RepID=A0A3B4H4B6_9CICH